uniref:Ionotropic glutamate receptor C-terminal domain-containing protein n=1 Tax=Glossina palpalis gambiensis TaxID=67801 RepID=A0A1B0B7S3_9MUSC
MRNFNALLAFTATIAVLALYNCNVNGQTSQNINVFFINEIDNDPASKAVEVVETYLKKNAQYGLTLRIERIEANKTDAKDLLETSVPSETVKSFTQALGLPTISASYGQEGDLRQWRDIDANKQKYLLQIMPPADLIPEVVRSIVRKMNITNAAILYDETFIMDHKYKSLLQNIQTRHLIARIAQGDRERTEEIEKLRNLDINNFFILGSLRTIGQVLEAVKSAYFQRNFAWHAITQDEGEIASKRDNATLMYLKPVVYAQRRERLGQLRTTYNLNETPQIMTVFYFDLALRAFLTVRDMIQANAWPKNMIYMGCDDYQGENTPIRNLDLKEYFIKVSEPTSYGQFELVSEQGKPFNGNSYVKFEMDIDMVEIRGGNSVNSKPIGRWTSGLDTPLMIKDETAINNLTADTVYRVYTVLAKCDKPEDQSDGISIENIGGVFIVIFVGIGMACITLLFEYWWYKYRKNPRIIDVTEAEPSGKRGKIPEGIILGRTEKRGNIKSNIVLRSRFNQYPSKTPKPKF